MGMALRIGSLGRFVVKLQLGRMAKLAAPPLMLCYDSKMMHYLMDNVQRFCAVGDIH